MDAKASLQFRTWGFPPYGALAAELKFCNEAASLCGTLSHEPQAFGLKPQITRFSRYFCPARDAGLRSPVTAFSAARLIKDA
jgi:hypothetical protein